MRSIPCPRRLGASGRGFELALGEVYLIAAAFAGVLPVELVGEDLGLFAAIGTIAGEGSQMLELFESGAVFRFVHDICPFRNSHT